MNGLIRNFQQLRLFMPFHRLMQIKSSSTCSEKDKLCYDEMMRKRQAEAVRSIVVQVNSEKSFPELYDYCSDFGTIVNAQHYRIYHDEDTHYILLEFSKADEAVAAINSSSCNEDYQSVPVRSPFLWFKAARGNANKSYTLKLKNAQESAGVHLLNVSEGTRVMEINELNYLLCSAPDIDEQIRVLHRSTQLNDLGVRLRFLAALQIQSAVSGMFPEANAQPFGSSVNGFGKMGCDLDLILRFDQEKTGEAALRKQQKSRLIFHTKENLTNERSQVQRQMESLGDILQIFLPGVCHVRRILQARVPIIKYHHEHLNLEVDLSMSNLTGFYMSELLYMFGKLDERVRPLTFTIRRWAHCCGLTNPTPGRWISNFSLTCLVMFFLQQLKDPILPSISSLMKSAQKEDIRITEDGINCTFGRNLQRLGFTNTNSSNMSDLLLQFFEFYSQFDFQNRAISLNEGKSIPKPDHSAMYIVNPLEQILNVSKNISPEECERLRIEVRNAAWALEAETEREKRDDSWGLLKIFKTEPAIIKSNLFFKPRMVEINELFDTKEPASAVMVEQTRVISQAPVVTTVSTPSPSMDANLTISATPTVALDNLKSASIEKEIRNIKAKARINLKQIRMNAGSNKGGRR